MKLRLFIDGLPHEIDSTDPELLGKWVTEILGRATANGITPATYIQMQVFPSWIPTHESPSGCKPDWIADTRIIGQTYVIKSAQDIVNELQKQLDMQKQLH